MGSIFNLSWFKTRKRQEEHLGELLIEQQALKNEILEKKLENMDISRGKPYKKLKFVNNVLTVIFEDGSILNKTSATVNDFAAVKSCSTENEVITLLKGPKEEKPHILDEIQVSSEEVNNVINFPDFETKGNSVYLKGIDRSLPALLVSKFAEIISKYTAKEEWDWEQNVMNDIEYISLKRFFLWCCLNPRAEVADKLYDFLVKNDFKITKQGFFVALRNVVEEGVEGSDHELVDAITNAYNKVKAVWKKNPAGFEICRNEDNNYSMHKTLPSNAGYSGEWIGNLSDLYLNLPNMKENRYTDNYTHTFDIRIGQKVTMPPEKCSWSTADCAEAGLHFAGHTAPYVLCGDTTVFTLHNPMKVVGIGTEKGRCWEYLPFMTSSITEAEEIMTSKDFDFLELDEQYAVDELENLEEKVKDGFAAEAKKHEFNFSNISTSQIRNIIDVLSDMNNAIKDRIVNV